MDENQPSTRSLRAKAHVLKPTIQIGKAGVTPSLIRELTLQLKSHELVKVKMLKSSLEEAKKKDLAQELAKKSDAKLIGLTGFTAILYKQKE